MKCFLCWSELKWDITTCYKADDEGVKYWRKKLEKKKRNHVCTVWPGMWFKRVKRHFSFNLDYKCDLVSFFWPFFGAYNLGLRYGISHSNNITFFIHFNWTKKSAWGFLFTCIQNRNSCHTYIYFKSFIRVALSALAFLYVDDVEEICDSLGVCLLLHLTQWRNYLQDLLPPPRRFSVLCLSAG